MKSKHALLLDRIGSRLLDTQEHLRARVHQENPNLTRQGFDLVFSEILSAHTFSHPDTSRSITFGEVEALHHQLMAQLVRQPADTLPLAEGLALEHAAYLLNCDGPQQVSVTVLCEIEDTLLAYPDNIPFDKILRQLQVTVTISPEVVQLVKPGVLLTEPPNLFFGPESGYGPVGCARNVGGSVSVLLELSGEAALTNIEAACSGLTFYLKHPRLKSQRTRIARIRELKTRQY